MGQFFTPLKIVEEMVSMVTIFNGAKICDPASGVGKFLLEAAVSSGVDFEIVRKNDGTPDSIEKVLNFLGTKNRCREMMILLPY